MDILAAKTAQVATLLEQTLGLPPRVQPLPPLDNLILTLLSQNTNDTNRDRAYQRLRARFPTWADVLQADVQAIAEAIRPAGLSNLKSQRMQAILRWVQAEYGALTLDALCAMPPDDAIALLSSLRGVGIKTIAVVLAFSCGVDIFPVDTHVHRLCNRIGLVQPPTGSAEHTFAQMRGRVPSGKAYALHLNLIAHGRAVCKARKPLCPACALAHICDFAATQRESRRAQDGRAPLKK